MPTNVRFGSLTDILHTPHQCPLLAISGHKSTVLRRSANSQKQTLERVLKNPKSSKIGFTEIPLESAQISLSILRTSGQPQRGGRVIGV